MSSNSSETDDDLGLLPSGEISEESDETKSDGANNNYECEFVTTSDLITDMRNDVVTASVVLNVYEGIAKSFLNKFEWNVAKLVDRYYDATDLNEFFASINIEDPISKPADPDADTRTECQICLASFAETAVITFYCGHRFCEDCCSRYFEAKVVNDGQGTNIKCPDSHCDVLIDDAIVIKLIPDKVLHILLTLITHSYVEHNPLLRYCPMEGCQYTMKANGLEKMIVTCHCGFESCLRCGEIWHSAITCELLEKWIRICIDDIDNAEWLYENTKRCPKCTFNIEKVVVTLSIYTFHDYVRDLFVPIGGCNHMQCTSCAHHFCWICRGDWNPHKTCNKFDLDDGDISAKLIHYSTRYANHKESLRLEHGILDYVVERMPFLTLQEVAAGTSTDMILLKHAVRTLRRSRQTLIATYVFAYFVEKCNQLAIFEDNQADLERATENLSWLLERGISMERWVDVKQKLIEKYGYCDKRRRVLLDHIQDGFDNKYWKLNDR